MTNRTGHTIAIGALGVFCLLLCGCPKSDTSSGGSSSGGGGSGGPAVSSPTGTVTTMVFSVTYNPLLNTLTWQLMK